MSQSQSHLRIPVLSVNRREYTCSSVEVQTRRGINGSVHLRQSGVQEPLVYIDDRLTVALSMDETDRLISALQELQELVRSGPYCTRKGSHEDQVDET